MNCMRRYAWWLVFLGGCQRSSGLGAEGGTVPTTTIAAAAPVESRPGKPEAAGPSSPDEEEILAFAREMQPFTKCKMAPKDPVCRDPARTAWLTEHVDWQLREATVLVMALKDVNPKTRKAVAEESVGRLDTAEEAEDVGAIAAHLAWSMWHSGEPCALVPTTAEEHRMALKWLKAEPPAELPDAVTAKLQAVLARRAAIRTLYSLRCGSHRVVIGRGEGPMAKLLPMW